MIQYPIIVKLCKQYRKTVYESIRDFLIFILDFFSPSMDTSSLNDASFDTLKFFLVVYDTDLLSSSIIFTAFNTDG